MKKQTKQKIIVIFIVTIFLLSPIYFFASGNFGNSNNQPTQLDDFVIEEELDFNTENYYISQGYTTLKFYSKEHPSFLDTLPDVTSIYAGQTEIKQLIVQKIVSNETKVIVIGPYGENTIENITQENIFKTLCETLSVSPLECGIYNFINSTNNISDNLNDINITDNKTNNLLNITNLSNTSSNKTLNKTNSTIK